MRTIYFHGMPGSPDELRLFDGIDTSKWIVPNRGELPKVASASERFDLLAELVRQHGREGPVRLFGFSLGAYVALETASRLPDVTLQLDLVSAAAPLDTGPFIELMAGRAVFTLARDRPRAFDALARIQGGMAAAAPGWLRNALFASARGEDLTLIREAQFRTRMAAILRQCLTQGAHNYRAELAAYVGSWSHILKQIGHPVTLWHGDRDNWAPVEMAKALGRALPNVAECQILPGLSHYSTLRFALSSRLLKCASMWNSIPD